MFSKKIVRAASVALVAAGLLIGPAGAAFAAPDRGEGERAEWRVDVGEWVGMVWGWLFDRGAGREIRDSDGAEEAVQPLSAADATGSSMDPNG